MELGVNKNMLRTKTKKYKILLFLVLSSLLLWYFREHFATVFRKPELEVEHKLPQKKEEEYSANLTAESLLQKALSKVKSVWIKEDGFKSTGCIEFPAFQDLEFDGTNWQVFRAANGEVAYLLGAYYDNRPILAEPVVRVISYYNAVKPATEIWCRLWFRNDDGTLRLVMQKTTQFNLLWSDWWHKIEEKEFVGQLVTCPIPSAEKKPPFAVSLADTECEKARNNLMVRYELPQNGVKKDFLICVKHMDFPFDDMSARLVEFFETNFLFGVDKIVVYSHQEHPKMTRVLNYYEDLGKVDYIPVSVPAGIPNEPFLRHLRMKNTMTSIILESVEYNDCFYRHIHQYNYVMLLDTDEIFVPLKASNYSEMLRQTQQVDSRTAATYFSINKIFLKDINDHEALPEVPEYLSFLQITTYATDYTKYEQLNPKAFFNTANLLSLNNHHPYECLDGCLQVEIPKDIGQIQHYRKRCFFDDHDAVRCRTDFTMEKDLTLWKFKDELVKAVSSVVEKLNLE